MTVKLAGIDFDGLIPAAIARVQEAATKALSGPEKEAWVIAKLEETVEGLLEQALPMFRPIIRPMLDFAVPLMVKAVWHALFKTP